MRIESVLVLLIVGVVSTSAQAPAPARPATDGVYEQFIALDLNHRRAQWTALNSSARTQLVQTHAKRWLMEHRSQLWAGQVAAVQEFIDFVPTLFGPADASASWDKERRLRQAARCRIGARSFDEAFAILHAARLQSSFLTEWTDWLVNCVL